MACLKDFNSIENLLMHMPWLQLSIELRIINEYERIVKKSGLRVMFDDNLLGAS